MGVLISAVMMKLPAYQNRTVLVWFGRAKVGQPSADVDALRKMGKRAIPELTKELHSDLAGQRLKAAWILGQMGPDVAEASPALVQTMDDRDQMVRANAIRALSTLGIFQKSLVPKLTAALGDSHPSVTDSAMELLLKIEEHNQVPIWTNEYDYVMAFVQSPSRRVQLEGLSKLARLSDAQITSAEESIMAGNDKWLQEQARVRLSQGAQRKVQNSNLAPTTNAAQASPNS